MIELVKAGNEKWVTYVNNTHNRQWLDDEETGVSVSEQEISAN